MEKKAGIAAFAKFKWLNAVNSIAGGDALKWAAVLNLPYEQFFMKQMLAKTELEYKENYHVLYIKSLEK
jgi:hypothetical protein